MMTGPFAKSPSALAHLRVVEIIATLDVPADQLSKWKSPRTRGGIVFRAVSLC
jgi:hypothetical protein